MPNPGQRMAYSRSHWLPSTSILPSDYDVGCLKKQEGGILVSYWPLAMSLFELRRNGGVCGTAEGGFEAASALKGTGALCGAL